MREANRSCLMFRRARIALVVALVAAILGFTGMLQNSAGIVQLIFYVVAGFSGVSLLFGLFEEGQGRANTGRTARVPLSDTPVE